MPAISLLVADIDGTLVTPRKELTERSLGAVRQLREAGILFAVVSGRPPRGMSMLTVPLALSTPVAAFNGGMIVHPDLTTILESRTLPRDVSVEVVEFLLGAGLDVWVYRGTAWFVRRRDAPHVDQEEATVGFAPTLAPHIRDVLDDVVKIVGVSDDLEAVARCESMLRQQISGYATVARSQPYYLDITHRDANKGMVVHDLSRRLNVPVAEVACIGDMPSDVLMFGVSSFSIAMGNASPEVQGAARFVTSSNVEEGFAEAVARFVLPRSTSRVARAARGR